MSAGKDDTKLSEQRPEERDDVENETSFNTTTNETAAFLPGNNHSKKAGGGDDDVESLDTEDKSPKFTGLTREELERYSSDPKWVKIRWVLFIILLVGWAGVLVAAIVIVAVEPKCPPEPNLTWYESGVAYQVDVDKFKDADGDGAGDLAGLEQKVGHFTDLSVESVWIENVVNKSDQVVLRSSAGSLDQFRQMTKELKSKGIRVIMNNIVVGSDQTVAETVVRHWTDAGAEGFVLSTSVLSDEEFRETAAKLQELLDVEFNKQDDRDRVIIGAESVSDTASEGLGAALRKANYTCSDSESAWECKRSKLVALATANDLATANKFVKRDDGMVPWKVLKADVCDSMAVCTLVVQLTIPGTPNVMYGDEIGLTNMPRGYMLWDDSESGGFTSKEGWSMPNAESGVESVLAQKSAGFAGMSVYSLFKDLAAVRAEEPSLQWGDFVQLEFGDEVFAFVRNATGRAPVVVAVNVGDGKAGSLVFGDYSMGQMLASSGVDIPMDEAVDLSAIYLPAGGAFVARMSEPEEEK